LQQSPVNLLIPPDYCQYANGPCDQTFDSLTRSDSAVFFIYPSEPSTIASTIDGAIEALNRRRQGKWLSWRHATLAGQIIFNDICKQMRSSSTIVADVTTLNFNVLFEIGFAIGLGLPVIPIRDTSFITDSKLFDDLAILSTLKYVDFTNSADLVTAVLAATPAAPLPEAKVEVQLDSPLYVLKGKIETEGVTRLMSTIKKSGLRFRTYDQIETPRLSLGDARRNVGKSAAVFSHLLAPDRTGAAVHNALCALVCGLAMAQQKVVAMLQEGDAPLPIDYRDVVRSYSTPNSVRKLLAVPIQQTVEAMQKSSRLAKHRLPANLLEQLDLGDFAAENEIFPLEDYFVPTGQFIEAKQGHARLVVGRKGSGKTAIFYGVRRPLLRSHANLALDMRPEGPQFARLRDIVLDRMREGMREHTMVAFWNYILLAELARAILNEYKYAQRDSSRLARYEAVQEAYAPHNRGFEDDFSTRLLTEVDLVVAAMGDTPLDAVGDSLTELIYGGDVKKLGDAVGEYLAEKDAIWVLVDNLDKGWPVHGATDVDILIVRALLEATRKLQRQLNARDVEVKCLVFIRSDIYDQLLTETHDKGKDSAIRLDWDDVETFKEIVRRRVEASTGIEGTFEEVWPIIADSHIDAEDAFQFIVDRTLMRPRDLLQFLHKAREIALNRGHSRILAEDIVKAEQTYSEEMLLSTAFEIENTAPAYRNALFAFQGAPELMTAEEVEGRVQVSAGSEEVDVARAIQLLVEFGFLGVQTVDYESERYLHTTHGSLRRLLYPIEQGAGLFTVHPAFRKSLDIGLAQSAPG
jgi:hypothetical protein